MPCTRGYRCRRRRPTDGIAAGTHATRPRRTARRWRASASARPRRGLRRGRLQHRHDRLRRDADRPLVPGPDPGPHLSARRQLRRPRAARGRQHSPARTSRTASRCRASSCRRYVGAYSHHAATRSLGDWLARESVPAVTGIDTRTLTRRLREHGTMQGWLFPAGHGPRRGKRDGARRSRCATRSSAASRRASRSATPAAISTILLVDAGAKDNIVRSLLERGASRHPRAVARRASPTSPRRRRHPDRQRPRRPEGPAAAHRAGARAPRQLSRGRSSASASATRSSRSRPAATRTSSPTGTAA